MISLYHFAVTTGVIIPLFGVLFGYTAIFLKVRSVKSQIRVHQLRQDSPPTAATSVRTTTPYNVEVAAAEHGKKKLVQAHVQRPGFTVDDVKLAKTLFAAFLVFLICWSVSVATNKCLDHFFRELYSGSID